MGISAPALLSAAVVAQIQDAAVLAPLHNAAGLQGIQAAQEVFGDAIPQVTGGRGRGEGDYILYIPQITWRSLGMPSLRYGPPFGREGGGHHVRHGEEGGQSFPGCRKRIV